MNRKSWILAAAGLWPAISLAAPVTELQSDVTFDVHPDASFVVEHFDRVRIDEQQAVSKAGQLPLNYSASLETIEVLEAYTTAADGTRIDVTPDKILEQQAPESSRAPMFSDRKVKTVVFPQVEVGSTVTVHWRRTQLKPDFAGLFSLWESLDSGVDVESSTVTLRAPASLELHVDTREADGGEIESPAPGMRAWRWAFKPVKGQPGEPRQLHPRDTSPYVMASTFKTYDELAKAYDSTAALMAQPSPEIRKLADQLTAGIKDRRAQARALYEWVGSNIRYVSISLGHGGFVPHGAEAIRAARYGDCKDHVTLLEALLAAKKIRSSAVLVNSANSYFVPKTVTVSAFNHAITYLPEFDLFLDSTPGLLPFGTLTPSEYGKQALVIDSGKGKAELHTLPLPKGDSDWSVSRAELTVSADGTVSGSATGESVGLYEATDREIVSSIPKDQLPQVANRMMGAHGTGTFEAGDPREFSKPFTYNVRFELPKLVKLPGPGAFVPLSGIARFNGTIGQFLKFMSLPERARQMGCPSAGKRTEILELHLPTDLKVTKIPDGIKLPVKFGAYESSYERKGDVFVSTRTLTLEYPSAVCGPEDYAELRDLATGIQQDLRAQIVYE
jgi:transglutaminase-like putative cysteine protease